ncbi:MAG: hypothetical protein U9O59_07005 [Actinomycetota bacterium]|nr:hypothetical protein [Actinomycetota bacterium]
MLRGKKDFKLEIIIISFLTGLILLIFTGCSGISYIPGASFGYFIWEEDGGISVEWSAERKDVAFEGTISTDGEISSYRLKEWEEDSDVINAGKEKISFSTTLGSEDYSDGFSFTPINYTYLEFNLRINGEHELSRINLGGFLENPEDNVFRVGENYFIEVEMKPWYQKRPFREFFHKLFSNKYFTFLYLFLMGVVIIEILRVTVIARRKRKLMWIGISYTALFVIEACIYFILRFLVR